MVFNFEPSQWHKGQRSHEKLIVEGTKEKFEELLGKKITNWNYNYNGVFQFLCSTRFTCVSL